MFTTGPSSVKNVWTSQIELWKDASEVEGKTPPEVVVDG